MTEEFFHTAEDAAADLNSAREVIRRLRGERDRLEFERDAAEIGCRQQLIEICRAAGEDRAAGGDIDDAAAWFEKAVAVAEQARHNPRLAVKELDPSTDKRRLELLRFAQRAQDDDLPFSAKSEGRRVVVTVAVCNRREADLVGAVLWPCTLAAGNLPALAAEKEVVFQISTTAFLKPFLTRSRALARLNEFCNVRFDLFPSTILDPTPTGWRIGRDLAALSVRQARAAGADLIVMRPDMVFSNNLFATLAEAAATGAGAVLTALPGLKAEEVSTFADRPGDGSSLALEPGQLAELALENLSQRTLAHVASSDNDFYFPDSLQLIWQDEGGLVIHTAEPHPLFLAKAAMSRVGALPWTRFGADLVGMLVDESFANVRLIDRMETCGVYLLEAPTPLPTANSFFDTYTFGQRFWRRCERFERWVFNHRVHLRGSYRIPYVIMNEAELAGEEERIATGLDAYQRSAPVPAPPNDAPAPRPARRSSAPRIERIDHSLDDGEEASAGAHRVESAILHFNPGLHTLVVGPLPATTGDLDGIAAPAIRLSAIPTANGWPLKFIPASPTGDSWLGSGGGTIVVKAGPAGGQALVTVYGGAAAPPAIDIRRIEAIDEEAADEIVVLPAPREIQAQPLRLEITAHIERIGNRSFPGDAWVGGGPRKLRLEAFGIRPLEKLAPADIQYKSIGPNGRETPWMSGANLCGTRGLALPLTGFAVRVAPELRGQYDVVYEGEFFEYGVTGPSRNGELCRSPIADDPLGGLNIRLIEKRGSSHATTRGEHQAVA